MAGDWTENMPTNKGLVVVVIVLGVAIIGALGVLVFGLVQQAKDPNFKLFTSAPVVVAPSEGSTTTFGDISVQLPPGAKFRDYEIEGNRLVVRIETGHTDNPQIELILFDIRNGNRLGRILLSPSK